MGKMPNRYYTNIAKSGNNLLVRELRDGERRNFKIQYKPTLYVPTRKITEWHAPDGTPVEPIQPGSMKECRDFLEKYKDVQNFKVYGQTGYEYAFLGSEYSGDIVYSMDDLIVANIDIEVASINGFPQPEEASEEITAITIYSSNDKRYHVFGCGKYSVHDEDVVYMQCDDECDLLEQVLCFWENLQPDILTGYACRTFDCPYLINRIKNILSEDDALRLSPWRQIRESQVNIFNKVIQVYDIVGISLLDYLLLYRKNILEPRESYRLDYIAQIELGEGKVDFEEHDDLQQLYEKDYQKFIDYNIQDVRLVNRIDQKRKLIQLQVLVAYDSKVNFVDVLSQVRTWESALASHLMANHIVPEIKATQEKSAQFTGAFVMTPIPGMYEWVCAFDVQSLYPNIIRTLSIGNDTKLTGSSLTPEMRAHQKYIKTHLMVTKPDGSRVVDIDAIMNGVTEDLIAHCVSRDVAISANGQFYKKTPTSVFSQMLAVLFERRLEYKAKVKKAKIALETASPFDAISLQSIISEFDLLQAAVKTKSNSLFGAVGNRFFSGYDIDNAEAVTTSGQFSIQFVGRGVDAYLNKKMGTASERYVVYSDTDSVAPETVIDVNGELVTIASFFEQSDGVISILPGSQYIKTLVPKQYTTKGFNGASITRKSIRYAMKHRVSKEMYEVCVGSNSIIVTEDHSLIVERNGDLLSIKPADIQYGDLLITKYIQTPNLVPGYEYQKEKNKNSNSFNRISISR